MGWRHQWPLALALAGFSLCFLLTDNFPVDWLWFVRASAAVMVVVALVADMVAKAPESRHD